MTLQSFQVRCPHCTKSFPVPAQTSSGVQACPHCGRWMQINPPQSQQFQTQFPQQPNHSGAMSGVIGGALLGAAIGGPTGAAVGGFIGLILGSQADQRGNR